MTTNDQQGVAASVARKVGVHRPCNDCTFDKVCMKCEVLWPCSAAKEAGMVHEFPPNRLSSDPSTEDAYRAWMIARTGQQAKVRVTTMSESTEAASVASVGSLCTGYGGLDMGLALGLGTTLRHAWHVEKGEAPSRLLAHRYPDVPNYGDITTLDYSAMERVDWLTAGYPCQPFSAAGKRLGEADARHLWPYVADTIGALRPRFVLLENVRGHLRRGLDSVIADLACLGYDAWWGVVRADEADAPHRRERVFVVAADASRLGWAEGRTEPAGLLGRPDAAEPRREALADAERSGREGRAPDALGEAQQRAAVPRPGESLHDVNWGEFEPAIRRWERVLGRPAPRPTSPRRSGIERLSPRFDEWVMGLPEGWITDVPGLTLNEQIEMCGNGVVPQQAALAVSVLLHNSPLAKAVAA